MTYADMLAREIEATGWKVERWPIEPSNLVACWIAEATRPGTAERHVAQADDEYTALQALARDLAGAQDHGRMILRPPPPPPYGAGS